MQSSDNALIGSSSSTNALQQKIVRPIGWQWPPTGIPQWGLRYSPHTSFAALLLQASQATPSWTRTRLTLVYVFSTARDSSPKNTRRGSSVATMTAETNDFFSFKTFWENTVQIAAFTAFPVSQHGYGMAQLTTTHWHTCSWTIYYLLAQSPPNMPLLLPHSFAQSTSTWTPSTNEPF
jgi:hypothetical protein